MQYLQQKRVEYSHYLNHNRFEVFIYILGLVFISALMLGIHFSRPYNSDDVAVQAMIQNMHLSDGYRAWVGTQTFLIKIPLYWLINTLFSPSRELIFMTAWIQVALGFSLYYFSVSYIIRSLKLHANLTRIGMIWAITASLGLYELLINPNFRNLEIGLSFLILAVYVHYIRQAQPFSTTKGRIGAAVLCIGTSLLLASDPLFLYMLIAPLAGLCVVRLALRPVEKKFVTILGLLLASVAGYVLVSKIMNNTEFTIVAAAPAIVAFDRLGLNIGNFIQGLLNLVGANFFGASLAGQRTNTLHTLINASLLALAMAAPIVALRIKKPGLLRIFLLTQPIWISLVYTFSTMVEGLGSNKYLILIPFYLPISLGILASWIESTKLKKILAGAMVMAICLNLLVCYSGLRGIKEKSQTLNDNNQKVISVLKENNLTKGYTDYWDAHIGTYLSDNSIHFIQAVCADGQTWPHNWYVDQSIIAQPADKSFILVRQGAVVLTCSQEDLDNQFGSPQGSIEVDPDTTILIYDKDVTRLDK